MYIHHQPKHWNTNRWGEHWSRCYNQMFCWKLWVLAFMWTPLWRVSSTQTWLQTKYPPSWQQHSLMAVPPLQVSAPATPQKRLRNGLMNLNWPLSSSDPKPNENLWDVPEPNGHGTSNGRSAGLRSGEFRAQVDTLRSSSCSSGRSWTVFAVMQLHCPAGGALPLSSVTAMSGCTLSAAVFGWVVLLKAASSWMLGLQVSQQNVPLSQDHQCCYFICHWF